MPYYDSEAIERARQVDLLTYLQTCEPQELVHVSGNVYCTKTHDSLRISNGKWCWFSRGIGGYSALDYLIKVNGYSFKVVLTLDSYEHGIMIRALNELRNDMLEEQRDPGPVEDVLLKTIDAPAQKDKKAKRRDEAR